MKTAKLLHGATDLGAPQFSGDILWRTRFRAPAPFFLVEIENKTCLFASSLECGRAKKEAEADEIILADGGVAGVIRFLKDKRVKEIVMPAAFPYGFAREFEKEFLVSAQETPIYPERLRKTIWEVGNNKKPESGRARACARSGFSARRVLEAGNVITVEPWLYYPRASRHVGTRGTIPAGGIRIEDMVLVTKTGYRNLTRLPKGFSSVVIP